MSNQEAVWTFLTDLKHRREIERRLFERARQNPKAVIAFIEALPEGWQEKDTPETTLLKRLHQVALQELGGHSDKSSS